jgi:hypothetical protein
MRASHKIKHVTSIFQLLACTRSLTTENRYKNHHPYQLMRGLAQFGLSGSVDYVADSSYVD